MLQKLWDSLGQIASLTRDMREVREENKKLRADLDRLFGLVELLVSETKHSREHDRHEREKMALKLENELLRFKDQMRDMKALPPKKDGDAE